MEERGVTEGVEKGGEWEADTRRDMKDGGGRSWENRKG